MKQPSDYNINQLLQQLQRYNNSKITTLQHYNITTIATSTIATSTIATITMPQLQLLQGSANTMHRQAVMGK